MAEKYCKFFVRRDKEDGRVLLPKGLALIKLHLYESSCAKDPESGRRIILDHLSREKLISIPIDISEVCHGFCAIVENIHPLLVDMGVPEHLQADIVKKITSSRHLWMWTPITRVPPIKVIVRARTDSERPMPFDPLRGAVTSKIKKTRRGATTRCELEGFPRKEDILHDAFRLGCVEFFISAMDLMMNGLPQ